MDCILQPLSKLSVYFEEEIAYMISSAIFYPILTGQYINVAVSFIIHIILI